MLYGAIAASLPDIDFIAAFWMNTTDDLLAHRGFTHSFCLLYWQLYCCLHFFQKATYRFKYTF